MHLLSYPNADEAASIDKILSDAVLEKAVKPLGRKQCGRELRGAIRAACERYLSGAKSSARKRRTYTLKHSAAIKDTARRLRRLLEAAFPSDEAPEEQRDELALMLFRTSGERYDINKIGILIIELDALTQAAADVPKIYRPDRGGPEADFELHVMLTKLKCLFESIAAKEAKVSLNSASDRYGGKFFAFVEPILAALDQARGKRTRSNAALGSRLIQITTDRHSRSKKRTNVHDPG